MHFWEHSWKYVILNMEIIFDYWQIRWIDKGHASQSNKQTSIVLQNL